MGDYEKIRDGMSIAALLMSGVVLLFGAAVALFLTGYCDGTCDRQWDPLVGLLALPVFGGGVLMLGGALHMMMPGQSAFAAGMPAPTQNLRASLVLALRAGVLLEGVLAVAYALAETETITGDGAWATYWGLTMVGWIAVTSRLVHHAQRSR